jgi:cobalamin biosynthesis Mg chelatase CobN
MKVSALLVLLMVLMVGCKTTKEMTETKSQVSETVKTEIKTSVDSASTVKASASILETVLQKDSLVVEETVVELSAPDSTGKQYPERITTRKAVAGKQTQKQVVAASDSARSVTVNKTTTDNSLAQTDTDTKQKVKKKKDSRAIGLAIALGVGLLAGLFIVGYFERDSLFKWLSGAIGWIRKFISI